MAELLLIGGDPDHRRSIARVLERAGYQVTQRDSYENPADEDLSGFDGVLAGAGILDRMDRLRRGTTRPLILVDRNPDVRRTVRAMKLGAADYLAAPVPAHELLASVSEALSADRRDFGPGAGAGQPFPIIGSSAAMRDLKERIEKVAPTDATVLIEGELGTGKELVARALHAGSKRNRAPLITVNCAAIPASLIEQELFGHGNGGSGGSGGLLEAAEGGTLLLDEVGELPLPAQARMLHFLADNEARPPGAETGLAPGVRIVATSHLDLKQLTGNGRFRGDLYYRLNVVSLAIPPLRDRGGDGLEIAEYVLTQVCSLLGKPRPELSPGAMEAIASYRWPGNIRELENVIERAAILCDGGEIDSGLLAIDTRAPEAPDELRAGAENVSLEEYFVRFVRENEDHLTETELAEKLGISRKSLWERRQRLGIPRRKTRKRGPRRP